MTRDINCSEVHPSLAASPTLDAYCAELRRWLRRSVDDDGALDQAGAALCVSAHDLNMRPEQLLIVLHGRGMPLADGAGPDRAVQDRLYVHAIQLLMQTYFGSEMRKAL